MRRARRNYGQGAHDKHEAHQLRIAKDTLAMTDHEAAVSEFYGGMTREQAKRILHNETIRKPVSKNPRRRNPRLTKNFRRQRIWNSKKRGGKADKRSFRMKKLKRGGRALFACPHGRWSPRKKRCKGSMKLYELLIPRGSRRSRSKR